MSLSMPIPLVELLKIDELISVDAKPYESSPEKLGEAFKRYQQKIWEK